MTISTNEVRNEYKATAGQTEFNYTFKIFEETDITVYVTPSGQVPNDSTDEVTPASVSGVGNENGGTVTLSTGANENDLVTLVSNIPNNRTTDYQNNSDFSPDTVNADIDRAVSLAKQARELANRALVSQQSQQGQKPLDLPQPEAGKILQWKSDSSGMENVDRALNQQVITVDVVFDVVADAVAATLDAGLLVRTIGKTVRDDGQGSLYLVLTPAEFGSVPDEINNFTSSNGNILKLLDGQTRFTNGQLSVWNGSAYQGIRKQRNYITDGILRFWRESTSQTTSGYGSDTMWLNNNTGSTKTHTQETLTQGVDLPAVDNPTAEFFSRTVVTSVAGAGNFVNKEQRIESVRSLAGKKCNLSIYAKADSVKNIAFDFTQNFGTGGSPSATVEGIAATKQEVTADWARYDFTVDIPSISGKTIGTGKDDYLSITFWYDAGSNFDSRTDSLGQQSGTFDIACVQLTEGETVYKFEEEDFQQSLDRVGRYFFEDIIFISGFSGSQTNISLGLGPYCFPSQMRAAPTFSPSNFTFEANATGVIASFLTQTSVSFNTTGRTTSNDLTRIRFDAVFDARL